MIFGGSSHDMSRLPRGRPWGVALENCECGVPCNDGQVVGFGPKAARRGLRVLTLSW